VVWGHRYSALPAVELAQRGFIFSSDTSNVYAAPDAALLLSDEFVTTHCFRALSGEGSLVGLQFQPIGGTGRIDVRGGTSSVTS
jgi:hypothetical protein